MSTSTSGEINTRGVNSDYGYNGYETNNKQVFDTKKVRKSEAIKKGKG